MSFLAPVNTLRTSRCYTTPVVCRARLHEEDLKTLDVRHEDV